MVLLVRVTSYCNRMARGILKAKSFFVFTEIFFAL
jgi:hypothetical protein